MDLSTETGFNFCQYKLKMKDLCNRQYIPIFFEEILVFFLDNDLIETDQHLFVIVSRIIYKN